MLIGNSCRSAFKLLHTCGHFYECLSLKPLKKDDIIYRILSTYKASTIQHSGRFPEHGTASRYINYSILLEDATWALPLIK